MLERSFFAAALAVLILTLVPDHSRADDRDRDRDREQSEDRDTQSRHENTFNRYIPMSRHGVLTGGRVHRMIYLDVRIAEVRRTDLNELGVKFNSLDRVDVSDVPLLGSLFEKPLSAGDFTADKAVGTVYQAGDGTLLTVLDGSIGLAGTKVQVVTGKGAYEIRGEATLAEVAPTDLGELGALDSIIQAMDGRMTPGEAAVLAGLTETEVPDAEIGPPLLHDIPVLQSLFRGRAYRKDKNELLVLIRPSIVMDDSDY